MILLDTCVVSETLKPEPDARVLAWVASLTESDVYLPSLVVGELRQGVESLPTGNRRANLLVWLDQLEARFGDRLLALDNSVARRWGVLQGALTRAGTPLPVVDSLLAAYALQHQAVLATRNAGDFAAAGVTVFNPWEA
jgi:predicted nucleic acid-binding protein